MSAARDLSSTADAGQGSGVRLMLVAAFFFSLMSLCVKLAGQRLPSSEIVFARAAFSLVATWVLLRGAGVSPWGHHRGRLLLRGAFGFCGLMCFFWATIHLPLADVTVIHFTNPVWTAVLASLLLGEPLRGRDVGGLAVCLAGVVLVARPAALFGTSEVTDPFPVLVALCGALCSALAYVTIRGLRGTEHHLVVVLYFPLVATPLALPLMAREALWPTATEWLLLLGVGAATQVAQIALTRGLHAMPAGRAMSVSYVQVVFAAAWGALVFDHVPGAATVSGAALVVAGLLLVTVRR